MQTCHPFLMNPEPKIYIFPHIHSLSVMQDAYTLATPLQPAYIGICAKKYKNEVGFPCHDKRSLILDLPHTGNVLESALQLHYEGYKSTISSYGKLNALKAFNFESKVTLEKLLHIEYASLCPSSLNIVFNPQALSLLLREPH
jgi:hypothetical protein